MQKLLIIFLIYLLVLPAVVFSQNNIPQNNIPQAPNVSVIEALGRIINWLWTILLIVALIAFLIAGYLFVTATGDPQKITTAWRMTIYTIVGVIVAGFAWGLVSLVRRAVEG